MLGYRSIEEESDIELSLKDHDELSEPLLKDSSDMAEILETSMNLDTLLENIKYRFENFFRAECSMVQNKTNHYVICQNKIYRIEISMNEINDTIIFAGRVRL